MGDSMLEINGIARRCLHGEHPPCVAACPFHLDIRGLARKVKARDFEGGRALMQRQLLLPGIIAFLCDGKCSNACGRNGSDCGLRVNALEQACLAYGERYTAPRPPARSGTVGIWGGISGLFVAAFLLEKGYKVTVFDMPQRPRQVPENIWTEELGFLERRGVVFRPLDGRILCDLQSGFDAVYLGTGGGEGIYASNPLTLETDLEGVFAKIAVGMPSGTVYEMPLGASCPESDGASPDCQEAADGRRAAVSVDRYLKQVSISANRSGASGISRLGPPLAGYEPYPGVEPETVYTREQASDEAGRCLLCGCEECRKGCAYLSHYQKYSGDCIRTVVKNVNEIWGAHHANRFIQSCNLCGGCGGRCPADIDMGYVNLEARRAMTRRGIMPPAVFHHPLRDMDFSCNETFLAAGGGEKTRYLLFPGCQLPASLPETTGRSIKFLRERFEETGEETGLLLSCCGAPADWAGQEEKADEVRSKIRRIWENMGRPRMVVFCPGCYQVLKRYLPEIPLTFISEVLERFPMDKKAGSPKYAWHDPCTTRGCRELQDSSRRLAGALGAVLYELPDNRDYTVCCGYGGLQYHTAPGLSRLTAGKRTSQSPLPYLTSCVNCRDFFQYEGKESLHLMELMFGRERSACAVSYAPFDFSERRKARMKCRRELMDMWGEREEPCPPGRGLVISRELREKMHRECILEDDIRSVAEEAMRTGREMLHTATGNRIAGKCMGVITYWVEYTVDGDGQLVIHNCYSHRMHVCSDSLMGET